MAKMFRLGWRPFHWHRSRRLHRWHHPNWRKSPDCRLNRHRTNRALPRSATPHNSRKEDADRPSKRRIWSAEISRRFSRGRWAPQHVIPASSEHNLLSSGQHNEAACGVRYQQEKRPIKGRFSQHQRICIVCTKSARGRFFERERQMKGPLKMLGSAKNCMMKKGRPGCAWARSKASLQPCNDSVGKPLQIDRRGVGDCPEHHPVLPPLD